MLKSLNLLKIYLVCLVIFVLAVVTAYVLTNPGTNNDLLNLKIKVSFTHIFFNNLKVVLLLIFLGPLTFGLGSIGILIINGIILGGTLGNIKNDLNLISLLLPHGVIEVPILIFATSVGIKLTFDLLSMKIKVKDLSKNLSLILLGLLIAASIETFITPMFLKGV